MKTNPTCAASSRAGMPWAMTAASWLVLLIPVRNASVQHVKRRTANCTLSWLGPMTDDDDILRQAQACCWSAAKAKKPEDRAFWLRLAEYWLSLVPKGGEPRTPQ